MKISKDRLREIIKEELENAEEEQAPEAPPKNKAAMAQKFKELYTLFPKIQGLDNAELLLLDKLITSAIKLSSEGSAKAGLAMALKKLGVEIDE